MTSTDTVVLTVDVPADAATVHAAIATEEGQRSFWTADADVPTAVGETARFGFPGVPVGLKMRIERSVAGETVVWACEGDFPGWAGSTVTWSLSDARRLPEGQSGTSVSLVHAGLSAEDDVDFGYTTHTWALILSRLVEVVTTGQAAPFFPAA